MTRRMPVLLAALLAAAPAPAAEKPRWELGAGVAPLSLPAYRGSDEQRTFVFPIPFIVYRGERLKVDRRGARGLLWDTPRLELDVSIDGAVPVDSSDEGPRRGLAELDPIVEVGPSLKVRLAEGDAGRLGFRLPVRAAIGVGDGGTHQEGWKVHPHLHYHAPNLIAGWDVGFNLGPKFASEDHHAYYYDLGPRDGGPGRPAYAAEGGYSGLSTLVSASQRFERLWIAAFVGYDYLGGAVFEDSPLVATTHAVRAGVAISWIFWQSEETVRVDPAAADLGR
jgi:outer membrane scaffolding protein for murein synthesis (MipA/OmpV family)